MGLGLIIGCACVIAATESPAATVAVQAPAPEAAEEEAAENPVARETEKETTAEAAERENAAATDATDAELEPLVIFRNGLQNEWQDFGWARRDVLPGQPARLDFFDHGGWMIGGRKTEGAYHELSLWVRAPPRYGYFFSVRLSSSTDTFPVVTVGREHTRVHEGNWREIRIPYQELNPGGLAFDTITLSAVRQVPAAWVYINNIVLESSPSEENQSSPEHLSDVTIDDTALTADAIDALQATPDMIGVSMHVGGGVPVGGGTGVFTAGFGARLSFLEGFVGIGVRGDVNYHTVTVQAADPTGAAINAQSNMVTVPALGVVTLRLPLGPIAVYGHTGAGGAWVWASRRTLDVRHSASTFTWAVHGAAGVEISAGPGWLGLEGGYLILPVINLRDVLQQYRGGGITVALHYRLGV